MHFGEAVFHALKTTLVTACEIFWALVLGFALSAVIPRPWSRKVSVLDEITLALSAVLVWLFIRTGGPEMPAHMEDPADDRHACHHHGHSHHHHHHHHHG